MLDLVMHGFPGGDVMFVGGEETETRQRHRRAELQRAK